MFETHSHLCDPQFDADRHAVIENAFQAGISHIVEIADGPEEWRKALALSESYPDQVYCALGFHPHHAEELRDSYLTELKELLNMRAVTAIGEIGIDYAKSQASPEIQARTLEAMLRVASEADKPIVLHCREGNAVGRSAHEDLFKILEEHWRRTPGKRIAGVLHCFSGTLQDAKRAIVMNLALGVDGPVTYKKNDGLRSILREVGLQHIVMETDSPYLPPQSIRGKRNDPSYIPEIAAKLAEVFEVPLDTLKTQTTQNAKELFRL